MAAVPMTGMIIPNSGTNQTRVAVDLAKLDPHCGLDYGPPAARRSQPPLRSAGPCCWIAGPDPAAPERAASQGRTLHVRCEGLMEPRRRTREAPPSRTDPRLPGEGRNNKSGGIWGHNTDPQPAANAARTESQSLPDKMSIVPPNSRTPELTDGYCVPRTPISSHPPGNERLQRLVLRPPNWQVRAQSGAPPCNVSG